MLQYVNVPSLKLSCSPIENLTRRPHKEAVLWLEVAMGNALPVHKGQAGEELAEPDLGRGQRQTLVGL